MLQVGEDGEVLQSGPGTAIKHWSHAGGDNMHLAWKHVSRALCVSAQLRNSLCATMLTCLTLLSF